MSVIESTCEHRRLMVCWISFKEILAHAQQSPMRHHIREWLDRMWNIQAWPGTYTRTITSIRWKESSQRQSDLFWTSMISWQVYSKCDIRWNGQHYKYAGSLQELSCSTKYIILSLPDYAIPKFRTLPIHHSTHQSRCFQIQLFPPEQWDAGIYYLSSNH